MMKNASIRVYFILISGLFMAACQKSTGPAGRSSGGKGLSRAAASSYVIIKYLDSRKTRGFENGFERKGGLQRERRDFNRLFQRFSTALRRVFPELKATSLWKKKWSFGAMFDSKRWWENISCNLHDSQKMGTESVNPAVIIRNRKLKIDYRFFYATKDKTKKKKLDKLIRRLRRPIMKERI